MDQKAATCWHKAKKDTKVNVALGGDTKSKTANDRGQEAVCTMEEMTIILDKSENEGADDTVMDIKSNVDRQQLQKSSREGGEMVVGRLVNQTPQLQRKIGCARRQRKKRVVKKTPRKTRSNLAKQAPKYESLAELAKASYGLTFRQLLRGMRSKPRGKWRRSFPGRVR